jgi:hypothetical protein
MARASPACALGCPCSYPTHSPAAALAQLQAMRSTKMPFLLGSSTAGSSLSMGCLWSALWEPGVPGRELSQVLSGSFCS